MTIYDIAREAGVSGTTVSRVINNSGYVSKEKRQKVLEVIEKHNYIPNAIAQGLISKQTRTLGMLVPDVINPFYATMFVAIEEEALGKDYNVILCNYSNDHNSSFTHIDMLIKKQVDAIIQLGGPSDMKDIPEEFAKRFKDLQGKLPVITNGNLSGENYYCVNIDDSKAIREMLEDLYNLGHRRFALIGGDEETIPSLEKHRQFSTVLESMGIPAADRIIISNSNFDHTGGRMGVIDLQKLGPLPTAIIGINELVATGIVGELSDQKYSIPEDISVVGFDNTYQSLITVPSLSGIGCDYKEYAQAVMEMVISAFEKKELDKESVKKVSIASKYYRRKSVGTAKGVKY